MSIPKKAEIPLIILLLLVICIFFFWQILTPVDSDRMIFQPGDFTIQFCAFARYQADRIAGGELPLWNPYNDAGLPLHADPQAATFYPFRWLLIGIFGGDGLECRELQYEVIFHVWMVSVMTFLFIDRMTERRFPAIAGAVVFTYSGYMMSYPILSFSVIEAGAWLPLILLGAWLSGSEGKRWGITLSGLGLGLSLLAGHPQISMYITALGGFFYLALGVEKKLGWKRILADIGIFAVIGFALGAVQFLPSMELFQHITRSELFSYDAKGNGYIFGDIKGMFWPDLGQWSPLYFGTVALILAGGAVARMEKRSRFWTMAFILSLGMAIGKHGALYDAFYTGVPVLGTMFRDQERITMLVAMTLAVLAALQLDWLMGDFEAEERKRFLTGFGIYSSFLIIIFALNYAKDPLPLALNNQAFTLLIALLFGLWMVWRGKSGVKPAWASALLLALMVFDTFSVGMNARNSFVIDEPVRYESAPLSWSEINAPDEVLYHVDGSWGIQGRGLATRVPDILYSSPIDLASIDALRQLPVDRMWEVLAVKYATLSANITLPDSYGVEVINEGTNYSGQPIFVYELIDPRPIAHLVYDGTVAADPEFARQIMVDSGVDLREYAVTSEVLPFELNGERPGLAEVTEIRNPKPERYEVTLSTEEDALLTFAIPNYDGWKAAVDGVEAPIIDTYAGLVGVPVPAGEGVEVILAYQPTQLLITGIISGAAVLGLIVFYIILVWRKRKSSALTD